MTNEIDPCFAAAHYEHDLKADPLLRAMQDDGIVSLDKQSGADERARFENALLKKGKDILFWNTSDAMFWAWQAALQAQPSAPANPNAMQVVREMGITYTNTTGATLNVDIEAIGQIAFFINGSLVPLEYPISKVSTQIAEGETYRVDPIFPADQKAWTESRKNPSAPADMPASDAANKDKQ
jgi:hypothetical protein